MTVEIAVQDVEGARIAQEEGVDRIELCAALGATGGITPSFALIQACSQIGLPQGVQVLIRPRGGSFVFDDDEKGVQLGDVRAAIAAGAAGVVVGGLDGRGGVDLPFASELIDCAATEGRRRGRNIQVTFHRAFDMVADQIGALESLIRLGYTRILTSGGAATAPLGLDRLHGLAEHADGRIQIQAGGGISVDAIADVLSTGVDAIHLSAKYRVASVGGPGGGGESAAMEKTDPNIVHAAVSAVREWYGGAATF